MNMNILLFNEVTFMVKAIVGANWGDEGKGKITDVLSEKCMQISGGNLRSARRSAESLCHSACSQDAGREIYPGES